MHFPRAAVATAVAIITTLAVVAPGARAETPAESLRTQFLAALGPSTATSRGVVVTVEGAGTVVDDGGSRALAPASTQKLYLTGAALLRLGPDYRLTTDVWASGTVLPEGTLAGDLVFVAGGDPTLTGAHLADLAKQVHDAGIIHVTGALWIDDSHFDRARTAPGWKASWVPSQSGPLSAFSLDRNQWRRDQSFLVDPVPANGQRFLDSLTGAGVVVDQPLQVGRPEAGVDTPVAHRDSPPLGDLVRSTLKSSDNFAAEELLKELGATDGEGSTAHGLQAVWQVAAEVGLPAGQAADGSGLSSQDRATAWHEVRWLTGVRGTTQGPRFVSSLAVSCTDGTLKQRFCKTPASGRVQAKTGSLDHVVTLSGFTTTSTGHGAVFAVLLSGVKDSARARAAIDKAVTTIVTSRV